ncbi:MAG: AAA-type ATPase lid domain-containing protein, partial [Telluria sp.]
GWDPAALTLLESYEWPGNVRELRNVVHRAYVMTEGKVIRPEVVRALLPQSARKPERRTAANASRRKLLVKAVKRGAGGRKK